MRQCLFDKGQKGTFSEGVRTHLHYVRTFYLLRSSMHAWIWCLAPAMREEKKSGKLTLRYLAFFFSLFCSMEGATKKQVGSC